MEIEDEKTTSTISAETSMPLSDAQSMVSPVPVMLPLPMQPIIPTVVPPSIVPPIAPIPSIPPPTTLRPLVPLPVHLPSISPPLSQNGEVRSTDSDSDHDDSGPGIHKGTGEYEISEESRLVRERQEKAMQELMMKRRAAALAITTNDMAVAKLDAEGQLEKLMKAHEDEEAAASAVKDEAEEDLQDPFYTEGSKALMDARVDIAKFSLVRAATRIQHAQRRRDDPDEDIDAEIDWALKQAEN